VLGDCHTLGAQACGRWGRIRGSGGYRIRGGGACAACATLGQCRLESIGSMLVAVLVCWHSWQWWWQWDRQQGCILRQGSALKSLTCAAAYSCLALVSSPAAKAGSEAWNSMLPAEKAADTCAATSAPGLLLLAMCTGLDVAPSSGLLQEDHSSSGSPTWRGRAHRDMDVEW
jgi:hypothetical protein